MLPGVGFFAKLTYAYVDSMLHSVTAHTQCHVPGG
jgi:hypothetical protein